MELAAICRVPTIFWY